MRRAWLWMTWWPSGWLGVLFAMAIAFGAGLATGLLLLDHPADRAIPMAVALALGSGIGQAWRLLRPKRQKPPAWSPVPPPGRPD